MKYNTSLSPEQKAEYEASSDPIEVLFYDILDDSTFPWMDEVTANFYNHIWDTCHLTKNKGDVKIANCEAYTSPDNEKKLYELAESTQQKIVEILCQYDDLAEVLAKAGYETKEEQRAIIAECTESAWCDIISDDRALCFMNMRH